MQTIGLVLSEICSGNELFTNGPAAQRRNIIIFSSATLRIEFRLKIFLPVHYPPGSNPHTKNCYPSLFSYKVIGKRRGQKKTEVESIAPSVSPTVTAGAKNIDNISILNNK